MKLLRLAKKLSWPIKAALGIALALAGALAPAACAVAKYGGALHRGYESASTALTAAETFAQATSPEGTSSGQFHIVEGASQIDCSQDPGYEYSELDSLGRAGRASACITGQMRAQARAKDRSTEDLRSITPSGWPKENPEVTMAFSDGRTYSGRAWNRSHLIAFSLGGATRPENIVAGTRAQNVGSNDSSAPDGMAYPETLARDWLDAHPDGTLWYSAEPVYEGDEPICREVVVDLRSDDGTLDMRVRVPNEAPGIEVDYSGESRTCTR